MTRTYGFIIRDFQPGVTMTLMGFSSAKARDDAMVDVLEDLPWYLGFNTETIEEDTQH